MIDFSSEFESHHHLVSLSVRLGGFHVAVNFMGTVGHLMKGSGIEQLLVEGSARNKGTADKVLNSVNIIIL